MKKYQENDTTYFKNFYLCVDKNAKKPKKANQFFN